MISPITSTPTLAASLDTLAPLKTKTVSFNTSSPWFTEKAGSPETHTILLFLQDQLDREKSLWTLKGMVAAIKAARMWRLHNFWRALETPPWDLELVLEALQRDPFESLESVSLKWLSLKIVFLLAVTSARRVGRWKPSVHQSQPGLSPQGSLRFTTQWEDCAWSLLLPASRWKTEAEVVPTLPCLRAWVHQGTSGRQGPTG